MRADRLISILLYLKNNEKMTSSDLACKLEVSERTIHRDMESLSSAGLPIVAERGKAGGWRLVDNWPYQLSWLKKNEIESLFVPHSDSLLTDLGLNAASSEASAKLLACIPSAYRQNVATLRERVYIDLSTWRDETESIQSFQTIQQAVWKCQKLRITYAKTDGVTYNREIEPLGLVSKSAKWYVVARRGGEFRTYRASRIRSAAALSESFIWPKGFNLKEYWKESKDVFVKNLPKYNVEAEVSPWVADRIRGSDHFVQIIGVEARSGEWLSMALQFETETEAIECVLGYGNGIKILSPQRLREKITSRAEAIIQLYKE